MRDAELFQPALGVILPWEIESSGYDLAWKRLENMNDFPRGELFHVRNALKQGFGRNDPEVRFLLHLILSA